MKGRYKILGIILIFISLCAFSCVSASDNENVTLETNDFEIENEEIVSVDNVDEMQSDDSLNEMDDDEDLSVDNDEDKLNTVEVLSVEEDSVLLKENDKSEIISLSKNDESALTQAEDSIISVEMDKDNSKLSASKAYIKSTKVRYDSNKYLYLGWSDYFSGYFLVYKGASLIHKEYLSGYDQSLKWSLNGMSPGVYKAKLVDDFKSTLKTGKIKIIKSRSKIKVKSFSAKAGTKFYCYAYVKDKYTGKNYNGGTVKFKIAGKTYKAKLKSGVAIAKIRIPSKIKKYTCKATFSGGRNVHGKSTKFKMVVKPKPKYKVVRMHTKFRYLTKKVGPFKLQTYRWKQYSIDGLGIFAYKHGKMLNRYKFMSKVHYKSNGVWKWSSWSHGTQAATAYHKFSVGKGVSIGDVLIKIRVS